MSNDKRVYRLLKSKKISVGKAEDGTFLCSIPHNGNKEILDIHSSNFRIAFKSFWKKEYGELLNDKEVQEIISIIEVPHPRTQSRRRGQNICRSEDTK